jgi:hypothetical protein
VAVAATSVAWWAAANEDAPAPIMRRVQVSLPPLASRPDLRPPEVSVNRRAGLPADQLLLLTPRAVEPGAGQSGAMAFDELGRTRWFRPTPEGQTVSDLRVQRLDGRPVLTWWEGRSILGEGRGVGMVVDEQYRTVATIRTRGKDELDQHELRLTPRGTALVTIYRHEHTDLTPLGGKPNARIITASVQEIDVATGEIVFEWDALDHIPIEESERPLPDSEASWWDYLHLNSIAETRDGDLLLSARHTSTVYKVDRRTGEVVWRLGGKRSDFDVDEDAAFAMQHDARDLARGVVQVFDNAVDATSSVKRIRLDRRRGRATLVRSFDQPDGTFAESQGNGDPLLGGGVLAGWGSAGGVTRFDRAGRVRFDAQLQAGYDSYRAHRGTWVGRPETLPALAASRTGDQVTLKVSWNGSTEVRRWQALAGDRPNDLEPLGEPAGWDDLETTLVRATPQPYVAVAALDARGRTLATSAPAQP